MSAFGNLSGTAPEHKARFAKYEQQLRLALESADEYLEARNCEAAFKDLLQVYLTQGLLISEGADLKLDDTRASNILSRSVDELGTSFRRACVAKGKGYQMPRSAYLNGLRRRRKK